MYIYYYSFDPFSYITICHCYGYLLACWKKWRKHDAFEYTLQSSLQLNDGGDMLASPMQAINSSQVMMSMQTRYARRCNRKDQPARGLAK